ncbi:hypothetical protein [Bacteroides sp. 51]|uniref:hypothetical protein n=1 Tax=Bacteroides sp. 51 TaxID=2302938 RepID=UPI0013D51ABC|nr:hypothetical protein [Bacteroides sp. 51]NDV83387.1 hypothetical protein [Bacteroides sp. 51]
MEISLDKLIPLQESIIKEIEEKTEGKVSDFSFGKKGDYAYFSVTYKSDRVFPWQFDGISEIYFDLSKIAYWSKVTSFTAVQEMFL